MYILEGEVLIYLDFDVYQLCESNEAFYTRLDTYAKIGEIQFVYSPTHLEEVCGMGRLLSLPLHFI